MLLYLVPVILAASRWGRGPAIVAVLASLIGHDVLYVDPRGTLTIARAEEALGLVVLLLTALVTAQLADAVRRNDEAAHAAAVARRSDELKTALLRAVTHDLRTPLASIKASVSALRQPDAAFTDADRAELLSEIEEESDRLERLVRNLLDASRVEAGSLRIHKRPQDMRELVTSAVSRVRPLTASRSVIVDVPEDLPAVGCDYQQIEQVVVNLLENAAVHTPPEAPSRSPPVRGRQRASRDCRSRAGHPAADRERLFGAFERGATGARGSGLGLAIARGFVEAHAGRIWVEDAPGGGARVVFTLPLQAAARLMHNVLVVDDEPQIRRALRVALRANGYAVHEAASGGEALDHLAQRPPDLVILDLVLPDMDGVEVCRRLREWSGVPVIVLSAHDEDEIKVRALDEGANDYVTKPFSMPELLARMRVALRETQPPEAGDAIHRAGDVEIDLARRVVTRAGSEVHLTPTEYALLRRCGSTPVGL